MCLNVVLTIFWNFQKTEEDIRVTVKVKAKDISMEAVLWKSANKQIELYYYESGAKIFNQNQIYNIFNQQQMQAQLQKMQQQYHSQQMWKVSDCATKLDDFLKSAEEIDAQYQQLAFAECCAVLGKYMQRQM